MLSQPSASRSGRRFGRLAAIGVSGAIWNIVFRRALLFWTGRSPAARMDGNTHLPLLSRIGHARCRPHDPGAGNSGSSNARPLGVCRVASSKASNTGSESRASPGHSTPQVIPPTFRNNL
jgi:hypothetical protein